LPIGKSSSPTPNWQSAIGHRQFSNAFKKVLDSLPKQA
jgi:hypothetical protein